MPVEDRRRVGHLRHPFRADKCGDLNDGKPRDAEEIDEPHLVGSRDLGALVLESVARTDFNDGDLPASEIGHVVTPDLKVGPTYSLSPHVGRFGRSRRPDLRVGRLGRSRRPDLRVGVSVAVVGPTFRSGVLRQIQPAGSPPRPILPPGTERPQSIRSPARESGAPFSSPPE